MSAFDRRGTPIFLETSIPAEKDIAYLRLDAETVELIGRNLREVPISVHDQSTDYMRIRRFDPFKLDVMYSIQRNSKALIVSVIGIYPVSEEELLRKILSKLNIVAVIRGASGL